MDGLAIFRDCPMDSTLLNPATNDAEQLIYVNKSLDDFGTMWSVQKQRTDTPKKTDPDNDLDLSDEDDDAFYMVTAPPPSPQEPSMLDTVFAEKLTRSLQAVASPTEVQEQEQGEKQPSPSPLPKPTSTSSIVVAGAAPPSWDHAEALDKLLRKVQREGTVRKKKRTAHITTKLKVRSLCNKTASELADAIAMIRLSASVADDTLKSR